MKHLIAGRHIWAGGCVTYCNCGHAYFGVDIERADDAWFGHMNTSKLNPSDHRQPEETP